MVVWGGNGKQAEEDDEVEEVMVPLLCARARCGWRRAGGRDLKIIRDNCCERFNRSFYLP